MALFGLLMLERLIDLAVFFIELEGVVKGVVFVFGSFGGEEF